MINCKKKYIEKKGSKQESINKVVTDEWHLYLKVMEAKVTQNRKEQKEHVQKVTQQNAMLITMIYKQQKKIEKQMTASKSLMTKMTVTPQSKENNDNKTRDTMTRQGKKKKLCNNCKSWVYHNSDKCHTLEKNKQHHSPLYCTHFNPYGTRKGGNQA